MQHIDFDGLTFVDLDGVYRKIYGCPLKQRKELAHALTELHKRLAASKIRTIAALYDHDPEFQAIAHECLSLCKIDPDWLSVDMMTEFLLPHRKENQPQRPLLEQLNFPQIERTDEQATEYDAIAALWAQTQNLEQALRLAGYEEDSPPWNELAEVMKARYERSPQRQEEMDVEAIAAHQEFARDLEQQLQNGAVGSEMAIASPQQADQLMEAIFRG